MSFLHGVEIVKKDTAATLVTATDTGTIALVGTAPIGPLETLTLISSARQARDVFGQPLTGFTIPQALEAIFAQGGGPVMVVNVFNPATMVTAVTSETVTVTGGKFALAHNPVGAITLTNSGGTTTYVLGTDYALDAYGKGTVLATITEGQSLRATYNRLNAAAITSAVVIGTINAGVYTGLKLLQTAPSKFGYKPGILAVPVYCQVVAVAAEMQTYCDSNRCTFIVDAPSGTASVSTVIGKRGLAGDWAGFKSASKRLILTWPHIKAYDIATDAIVLRPLSAYVAGLISNSDRTRGVSFSPSNVQIQGILGTEYDVAGDYASTSSDINLLNAAGITTIFVAFGTGFRLWGNRSAAFPATSTIDTFIAVQRTRDLLEASVQRAMLPFLAQRISFSVIDAIRASVNGFISRLVQQGDLVDGECSYIPADNPAEQLGNGQLVFQLTFVPPPPAERITFNSVLDINLLTAINEG